MISKLDYCPKCKGFLMMEKDIHGRYFQCLQCGYTRDLPDVDQLGPLKSLQTAEDEATIHAALDSPTDTAGKIQADALRIETIAEIIKQSTGTAAQ